ncbi:MAG: beta-N-acetylglucosaminidase [Flavobacteriaceae bacterium]|nr:beta-N-acetylglucosaminidase [Flavobacteriaceae bacterium]|tara:strand:+ start:17579 stop:20509 length:2931 start_codon:yes stop_codon:yes gene_type:complete
MRYSFKILLFLLLIPSLYGQKLDPLISLDYLSQEKWVDSIYNSLSIHDKIGQLFMPMVFSDRDSSHLNETLSLIKRNKIGGIIFSKGTSKSQIEWTNLFQSNSKIPLLITMDAEWGVAMRLNDVLAFPWNMTLGAINDDDLIEEIGNRIGHQAKRIGLHMNFGPVLDINTNPKNPIIGNRSFGESVKVVSNQSSLILKGMQKANLLTSGKHFPGHGDTSKDSHKTLPTIKFGKERINNVELAPYRKLIKEGISSIMIGHLNVPSLQDKGIPTSLSKNVITEILKHQLGFNGLIITDALNMKGVSEEKNLGNIDLAAFLAGNDILLMSENIPKGIKSIEKAYYSGIINESRLKHSVKKILKAKYKSGLKNFLPINKLKTSLSSTRDTMLVSRSFQKAITALENKENILPLKANQTYGYLKIDKGDGTYFNSQLNKYSKIDNVSIFKAQDIINQAKRNNWSALIIGWHSPAKDNNPFLKNKLPSKVIQIIKKVSSKVPVIINVFGSPYAVSQIEKLKEIKGLIVSYQNNKISQLVSADALFGINQIEGKLPVSVGNKYKFSTGIYIPPKNVLGYSLPAMEGFNIKKLEKIDTLAQIAIDSLMTPGIQLLVSRRGKVIYQKNYGYHTYQKLKKVNDSTVYDLASLTKILATLPLIINEVSIGDISLNTKIKEILPDWRSSNKSNISLKEILSHYGRLKPWIPFYIETLDKKGRPKRRLYNSKQTKKFPIRVTENLFLKRKYEDKIINKIKNSDLIDSFNLKNYTNKKNYSDLAFFIAKEFLESKYLKNLDVLSEEMIFKPLNLKFTTYNPKEKFTEDNIAPSEIDDYFRYTTLKGEVHDMAAAMQSGVGGHAGLFSNAYEIAVIMQMFLQKGDYNSHKFFKSSAFDLFNQCYYCEFGNRRGVGFDKPQISGTGSTCGCVSSKSFGHSGFTGTYTWADPEKEIVFVFLSNRTFPSMENNLLTSHNIRTRIQGLIYDALED